MARETSNTLFNMFVNTVEKVSRPSELMFLGTCFKFGFVLVSTKVYSDFRLGCPGWAGLSILVGTVIIERW